MKTKAQIAEQWEKHLKLSRRGLSHQYENTRMCQQFYAGDTMAYEDKIQFQDEKGKRKRAQVQFNKVRPYVDAVSGFMAQNRRRAKYGARLSDSQAQELYSKYSNALADYVRENANADQIETDMDTNLLVCGYSASDTDMSYIAGNSTTEPNGEILMSNLDPETVGWDARARARNLTDSRWAFYPEEYDIEEALELFDDSEVEDFEVVGGDDEGGRFYFNPYGGRYDKIRMDDAVEWSSKEQKLVRVYNYQWFEYQTFYRANNPVHALTNPEAQAVAIMELERIAAEIKGDEYGDMFDFDPQADVLTFDEKARKKLKEAFGDYIEPVAGKRKCFYTAIVSGRHVFSAFKSICQQGFSIKFKTGGWDAANKKWIGMVNSMAEPARYYNKALTELMFTIAANSKGGVVAEKGAIEDVAEFEAKYARTDAVVIVEENALTQGKIQPKAKPAVPTGLESIVTLSDAALADTSGVDRSFLGSSENAQETGILYKRRIRQVVSTMAKYFDSITLYSKLHARMLLDYMRVYAEQNDGALFPILGENGAAEYAQIAADKFAAEYDVTIQEAAQTPEDKQEMAEVLSTFGDKFLQIGDTTTAKGIFAVALSHLNIDGEDRAKLTELLQPQEQPIDPSQFAQMQQMLQQLMSERSQLEAEELRSKIRMNMSKAGETDASRTQKAAQTAETAQKAEQAAIENLIAKNVMTGATGGKVSVNI